MFPFKIGYRTIKTAIGAAAAISIAQFFGLNSFASAGILTILCVQSSKKKSLQAAYARFFACMIAIAFSYIFFETIAYHTLVLGLLILAFIPITVWLRVSEGIVTSSVIILHLFTAKNITLDIVYNEIALIVIGIGVALLVNLYMPSLDNKLKQYQVEIEDNFRTIFQEMVSYLRTNESRWVGNEIIETARSLDEAKSLAFRDVENHFLRTQDYYYYYFKTREKQFEIIERILPMVTSIDLLVVQRFMIADFLEELSEGIHPGNTAQHYLNRLHELHHQFKEEPLPTSRDEFEARAQLFRLLKEMEQYLLIKKSLKVD
ncbi:aromatic acid exporter family protein [Neobacillus sp. MM2021_6]|uniref:aromatic acid exporter family protein n=1 Tax=Bacillaceae TaxID=186817 RepID=UPI00140C8C98|nr:MULTISPECIES: aromatic acid exporter family protein [Bacillaceae]MBO0959965.1 aromatic acid exporter family protein [Neobacillus sp. MM2021_6]NHC18713.1 aromatic acid exporter family protein [Bacillus sp. MM2020_4]